jgi:glucosamine-6-phosphate deaminase
MNLIITDNYKDFSFKLYSFILAELKLNPKLKLSLPTGKTPLGTYKILAKEKNKNLFKHAKIIEMDEYILKKSNFDYLNYHLIKPLKINKKNFICLEECEKHEKIIRKFARIDLIVLGLGLNGHIAFNEPGTSFFSKTHIGELSKTKSKVYTIGIDTIMNAKKIILAVNGKHKSEILNKVLYGKITPEIPATILRKHDNIIVLCDKEASVLLNPFKATKEIFKIYESNSLPKNKTICFISPHPDDSAISAGATLYNMANNNNVYILVTTSGTRGVLGNINDNEKKAIRKKEAHCEAEILKAKIHFLDLKSYTSESIINLDAKIIYDYLLKLNPDIIFSTNVQDMHNTHSKIYKLAQKPIFDFIKKAKKPVEIWHFETPWANFRNNDFNTACLFNENILDKKLQAISCHKSQIERTDFVSIAKNLAHLRCEVLKEQYNAANHSFAEVFSVEEYY